MLMTSILDYRPEPGHVVDLMLTNATIQAATDAPEHPTPPSLIQEYHIWRKLANQSAGRVQSSWLGMVFDLPGRLRVEAMAAAMRKWILRHPTLLTWFENREGTLVRHVVSTGTLEVTPTPVGELDTPELVRDYLHHRLSSNTDPLRWPPFAVGAVIRETSSTVYFGVDHSHSDGNSVFLAFKELCALYQAELDGVEAELLEAGSYVDYGALERDRAAELTSKSEGVNRWRQFWRSGPFSVIPLDLGTEPDTAYPSATVILDLFDGAEAEAFSHACREHGAEFPAGLFAALGIAAHELGGFESYRTLTPVNTRNEARWKATQGWFVNLVPVTFRVAGRQNFGQVVGAAQHAFTEAQRLTHVPLIRVAELLRDEVIIAPYHGAAPAIVSFLDNRAAPGARDWDRFGVRALVGTEQAYDASIWINRARGKTHLYARYPDTEIAQVTVPRFVRHLRDILLEVAREDDRPVTTSGRPAPAPGPPHRKPGRTATAGRPR